MNFSVTKYAIPKELKTESYERKKLRATFARLDLVLKFRAGKDGIGAITRSWTDAIYWHDCMVKKVEEQMDIVDQLRKIYNKEQRTFRNWDAAWNALNRFPEDYIEYRRLDKESEGLEDRIKDMDDPVMKALAQADFDRWVELSHKFVKVVEGEKGHEAQKEKRDEASKNLTREEAELNRMRDEERKIGNLISDDHVVACNRGESLSQLFPNIHLGMILSTINEIDVENLPHDEVMHLIKKSFPPHRTEFRRYDYQLDVMTQQWRYLSELRDEVCERGGWARCVLKIDGCRM